MTTALAIPKQNIIVQTEDMTYPVEYREEKPVVPKPFVQLLERVTDKQLSGTKSEVFSQYASELKVIEKGHRQLREFMDVVCECNLLFDTELDVYAANFEEAERLYLEKQISQAEFSWAQSIAYDSGNEYFVRRETPNQSIPFHFNRRGKKAYKGLLATHLSHRLKELPDLSFRTPNTGRAEVAALKDIDAIRFALTDSIKQCWAYLIWMTLQSFDYLTAQEMMGVIEWHAPDVARYNFFTGTWMERQLQERTETHTDSQRGDRGTWHTRFTKVERDMERTYLLTRHTHDLIEAERVWPSTVDMPSKAQRAADRVPDFLKHMVEVVTGNLVFMQEVQEQVLQESWTEKDQFTTSSFERDEPWFQTNRSLYKYDPALIIGHYVITGWV